ncbi:MAG: hypothetical protein DWQ07_05095 [Chloroflexi bacterium]|nr:MAG: hypothetical protein DWQ07_05095 [Chloroflexota bacterium]MBL1194809.1 hypothetical protein [Chloroflexota bacterium]NOH12100.1 flagellar basal body-associated FliL family protein [Chloroflexota bacterium]
MKKMLPTLKYLFTGAAAVAILTTMGINLLMAYIMFAPDDLPKPFYLAYQTAGMTTPQSTDAGHQVPHSGDHSDTQPGIPTTINFDEVHPGEGIMLPTGSKVANLADPGGRKYIKIDIVLEFAPNDATYYELVVESHSADSGGGGGHGGEETSPLETYVEEFKVEVNDLMPAINDSLLTLISSKTFEQINTAEGKEHLRVEIMELVNSRLSEYHVIAVYFTEFVVQ